MYTIIYDNIVVVLYQEDLILEIYYLYFTKPYVDDTLTL